MTTFQPSAGFRLILGYITPHRRVLLAVLVLLVLGSALSLANPWMAGLLTTNLTEPLSATSSKSSLLMIWMVLMILNALVSFASQYYIGSIGAQMTAEMRRRIYQHLQALPVAYYHQRRAGETLSLLSTDASIISSFVTDTMVQLLPATLTFVGAFALMAWLDMTLALLVVLLLPVFFIAVKFIGRRLRPLSRAWVDANSDLVSLVEENLGMLPAIKAFTREEHESRRFDHANTRLFSLTRLQLWAGAMLSPAVALLGGLSLLGLLWVGTGQIDSGKLSASELVSVLLYAALMINPLRTLANVYGQVQRTRGSAERIVTFMQQQAEPVTEGEQGIRNIRGDIEFQGVGFAYLGRPTLFSNLHLHIGAGETVAITGRNGIGKSTLAHLLMRFAEPDSGRILIDNTDIRQATLASIRSQVGLVAQQILLLNGTVTDNIAYGEPEASFDKIEQAARAAHALEFITALPKGFDTIIGDQGMRLSGGQRQRLALARALLKDPPILILDEATAMFDPAGEQAFIEECRDLIHRKTVILITHRPASLALADHVVDLSEL
ncbi:MAG: ABC transporter ATP-binding protein [Pseudomonadota bacterium]